MSGAAANGGGIGVLREPSPRGPLGGGRQSKSFRWSNEAAEFRWNMSFGKDLRKSPRVRSKPNQASLRPASRGFGRMRTVALEAREGGRDPWKRGRTDGIVHERSHHGLTITTSRRGVVWTIATHVEAHCLSPGPQAHSGRFRNVSCPVAQLAIALWLLGSTVWAQDGVRAGVGEESRRGGVVAENRPPRLPEQILILRDPREIQDLWNRLQRPDLILIRPDPAAGAGGEASSPAAARTFSHVVQSLKIRGRVERDLAELAVDLEVELLKPGRWWVPIRLEDQVLLAAREGDRELELRNQDRRQWEVRLEGLGTHRIRVELMSPVKSDPVRKRLEIEIPEAPSTSLELDFLQPLSDVDLGGTEPIARAPLPNGRGMRLTAHLAPRPRLALSWSDEDQAGPGGAPLLSALGEIALEVDSEAVAARSSWVVRCIRGIARKLEIGLDEQDIVTRLQLDDQILVAAIEQNVLTVPLGEPLRPGLTRRVVLETRRNLTPGAVASYQFAGFPLANAGVQAGAIGITQGANLWVNVGQAQGLRRIDPRELPSELRARPGTTLAFQFLDQPFRLGLAVESSPPLYRAETVTRITLDAELARSETTIEVQRLRGRLGELEILVPRGLQLSSVGPPELVEASTSTSGEPAGGGAASSGEGEVLKVRLTPQARDRKSWSLQLRGQQQIGPDRDVALGLFTPRGGVASTSNCTIFAPRDITFELVEEGSGENGRGSVFRTVKLDERSRRGSNPTEPVPVLSLRSDQSPSVLRGRLTRHALAVTRDDRISARISRRWIDVRQDVQLDVRFGVLDAVRLRVPPPRSLRWEVQGKESIRREEVSRAQDGSAVYRLEFDPPIADRSILSFRFQVPLTQELVAEREVTNLVPWLELEEATADTVELELTADAGIRATVADALWRKLDEDHDPDRTLETSGRRYRLADGAERPGGCVIQGRLLETVALPPIVIPRALFRTVVASEGVRRVKAWFWIESHRSTLSFRLPRGASLLRTQIDGRLADLLLFDPATSAYQIDLPPEARKRPILAGIEYQFGGVEGGDWTPPELLGGGAVLQTLWEIQLPWNQALVGVPSGWTDVNEWYWDLYVWKRRPAKSLSALVSWVAAGSEGLAAEEEVALEDSADSHEYLFMRIGPPVELRPWIVSRTWIVAASSGAVLTVGFLLLFRLIPFRLVWMATAALVLVAVLLVHPSILVLVVQSGVIGLVLSVLGFMIQWLVERRRPQPPLGVPGIPTPGPSIIDPSRLGSGTIGSDESTAIRARVSSTMDLVTSPLGPGNEPEPLPGSPEQAAG